MYLLIGLPLDTKISESEIIYSVKAKTKYEVELLSIPALPWNSFESLMSLVDNLDLLEENCLKTLKGINRNLAILGFQKKEPLIKNLHFDSAIKNFKWEDKRFQRNKMPTDIYNMIFEEFTGLKESFVSKNMQFDKINKEYEKIQKEIEGTLRDVDVSSLMEWDDPQSEFINYYFVVVEKNREKEFKKFMKELKFVSTETLEETMRDKSFVLFKFIGMKSSEEELKKKMIEEGYSMKFPEKSKEEYELKSEKKTKTLAEYEITKNNYIIFLHTSQSEVFILMMHCIYIKLYVECVLRYGIPSSYIYFIVKGSNKASILSEWDKFTHSWSYSKRISHGFTNASKDGNKEKEHGYAYCFVEDVIEEDNK